MASSALAPVALHRVSTVEALSTALREQILDGTTPAGSPLREAEISETFGVSRHTVRTALQTLCHEGIVRHAANRGAHVSDLTDKDVADLFRLRRTLETNSVQALASGDGDISHVREALEALGSTGPDPTWGAVRDADLAFHQALVDALRSSRTSRTYASLVAELRLCFQQLRPEFEAPGIIIGQHTQIFRAIESGDGERAERLVKEHLDQSMKDIIAGIPQEKVSPTARAGSQD